MSALRLAVEDSNMCAFYLPDLMKNWDDKQHFATYYMASVLIVCINHILSS